MSTTAPNSAPGQSGIKLSPYELECLIERAAIIEYEGQVSRAEAERAAKRQFMEQRHRELLRGIQPAKGV